MRMTPLWLLHLLGAAVALSGAGVLGWLLVVMYRGTPADEDLMIKLGIPVILLLTLLGIVLTVRGLSWLFDEEP